MITALVSPPVVKVIVVVIVVESKVNHLAFCPHSDDPTPLTPYLPACCPPARRIRCPPAALDVDDSGTVGITDAYGIDAVLVDSTPGTAVAAVVPRIDIVGTLAFRARCPVRGNGRIGQVGFALRHW